ncbi:MAG: T9SS type A sorting domain-containing protein, partial [Sphingobacteriales bacterium]
TVPLAFNGNTNTYTWTNDNPAIGLPASGMGNLPSFTTVNNSAATQFASIKVFPQGTGCTSKTMAFRIQVNPCGPVTTVSPNPATTNTLRVTYNSTSATQLQVTILDANGLPVAPAQSFSGGSTQVDISALRPGIYYVQVTDVKTGASTRTQLVKL